MLTALERVQQTKREDVLRAFSNERPQDMLARRRRTNEAFSRFLRTHMAVAVGQRQEWIPEADFQLWASEVSFDDALVLVERFFGPQQHLYQHPSHGSKVQPEG